MARRSLVARRRRARPRTSSRRRAWCGWRSRSRSSSSWPAVPGTERPRHGPILVLPHGARLGRGGLCESGVTPLFPRDPCASPRCSERPSAAMPSLRNGPVPFDRRLCGATRGRAKCVPLAASVTLEHRTFACCNISRLVAICKLCCAVYPETLLEASLGPDLKTNRRRRRVLYWTAITDRSPCDQNASRGNGKKYLMNVYFTNFLSECTLVQYLLPLCKLALLWNKIEFKKN